MVCRRADRQLVGYRGENLAIQTGNTSLPLPSPGINQNGVTALHSGPFYYFPWY